ncbi:hypothetical protein ACQJBY_059677 [Aegilops geniculata]
MRPCLRPRPRSKSREPWIGLLHATATTSPASSSSRTGSSIAVFSASPSPSPPDVLFVPLEPMLRFRSGVVRIRSTTFACLLLGLVLLPCGISGKMTIPSKSLLSLLARLLALLLCLCCDTYHLLIMPPILLNQASNPHCPSKPLFGYVTALLSPSYSVVSCR